MGEKQRKNESGGIRKSIHPINDRALWRPAALNMTGRLLSRIIHGTGALAAKAQTYSSWYGMLNRRVVPWPGWNKMEITALQLEESPYENDESKRNMILAAPQSIAPGKKAAGRRGPAAGQYGKREAGIYRPSVGLAVLSKPANSHNTQSYERKQTGFYRYAASQGRQAQSDGLHSVKSSGYGTKPELTARSEKAASKAGRRGYGAKPAIRKGADGARKPVGMRAMEAVMSERRMNVQDEIEKLVASFPSMLPVTGKREGIPRLEMQKNIDSHVRMEIRGGFPSGKRIPAFNARAKEPSEDSINPTDNNESAHVSGSSAEAYEGVYRSGYGEEADRRDGYLRPQKQISVESGMGSRSDDSNNSIERYGNVNTNGFPARAYKNGHRYRDVEDIHSRGGYLGPEIQRPEEPRPDCSALSAEHTEVKANSAFDKLLRLAERNIAVPGIEIASASPPKTEIIESGSCMDEQIIAEKHPEKKKEEIENAAVETVTDRTPQAAPPLDMGLIVEKVFERVYRQQEIEKERKGYY